MKKSLFDRRIPTVFAFLILIGGLLITTLLIQQGVFIVSKASPNEAPQNVQIANITDTSFTVVFTTPDPTIAAVGVTDNGPSSISFDTRNPEGNKTFLSHFITVKNLKPDTKYEFSILSNGTEYLLPDGKKYTTQTVGDTNITAKSAPLLGAVILPDGKAGSDVLVTASSENTTVVAAITNSDGTYNLPLNLLRETVTGKAVELFPKTKIDITAEMGKLSSHITFSYKPGEDVPTISLSNNYAFIASEDESNLVATLSSDLTVPSTKTKTEIKIVNPKSGQTLIDQKPQIRGTAVPSSLVKIILKPDTSQVQVRSDPNGNWAYRPSVDLTPGVHTVSIETPDLSGNIRVLSTSFTVFSSGSQIAESATPSATPTIKPSLTPILTPTIGTPSPTPAVTGTITPTVAPTIAIITPTEAPTLTPTPTIITIIPTVPTTPPKTIPPTGSTTQAIFLTTLSILFIVSGSALLFIL